MTFLTDRKEIAKAMNIDRLPVIKVDCTKAKEGWDRCYEGGKVVVLDSKGYDINCEVNLFGDEENAGIEYPHLYKKICLMPEPIGLHADFGYSDVMEMADWNRAVRIQEDKEVLVIFDYHHTCFIRKMKVGKVSKFVYPTAVLKDID